MKSRSPDKVLILSESVAHLAESIERLAAALEKFGNPLGESVKPLYTRPLIGDGAVDERTMAGMLNISHRTLEKYRRQGRFPNCWIRNSRRILWRVVETQESWDRGIA